MLEEGRDAIRAFLRDFHASADRTCTITLAHVESSGDLGFVIGPLVAGWSAQAFGFGASFAINAIPAVVALGLVLSIRETMHARRVSDEGRGL